MLTCDIMTHVTASKHVTAEDAKAMRQAIYQDGAIDSTELEMLFVLDEAAQRRDPEWSAFFVEAVTDFIVNQEEPRGYVSEANARWLIDRIGRSGKLHETEKAVLRFIAEHFPDIHPSLKPLIDKAV